MLSWEMQLALLDGANFDHWLPSCCRAFVSSLTQVFRDWSTASPAVAARSSLQLRTMSNVGTRSATVTTSCELKAIIEIEIGILLSPCIGLAQGDLSRETLSARSIAANKVLSCRG